MNHDYGHCLDCTDDCPKDCWRAELTRELKNDPEMIGIPVTWSHFRDTNECPVRKGTCSDILTDLSDSRERINGLRAEARELRLQATRTTSRTDEPYSGGRNRHGAPTSWDKLAEIEERLQEEERRRDALEQEAADAFEQMDSVRKTQILRLRWLYGLPLEQVADRLCWSESTIRHDAAEAMEDLKRLERSRHER